MVELVLKRVYGGCDWPAGVSLSLNQDPAAACLTRNQQIQLQNVSVISALDQALLISDEYTRPQVFYLVYINGSLCRYRDDLLGVKASDFTSPCVRVRATAGELKVNASVFSSWDADVVLLRASNSVFGGDSQFSAGTATLRQNLDSTAGGQNSQIVSCVFLPAPTSSNQSVVDAANPVGSGLRLTCLNPNPTMYFFGVYIVDCHFNGFNNTAVMCLPLQGVCACQITLQDSSFVNNRAPDRGGAVKE